MPEIRLTHKRQHIIISTDDHAATGLTPGQVLTATGATSFAWAALPAAVPPTRLVSTLAPLSGGGDLSADRVLSLQYGPNLRVNASNQLDTAQDIATGARPTFAGLTVGSLAGYVKSTAGVLSAGTIADADLPTTLVRTSRAVNTTAPLAGGGDLSANRSLSLQYSANLRVNASNQLDTVQDIGTGARPTFAGLTVGALGGVLKASGGVVAGGAAHGDLTGITTDQHHTEVHALAGMDHTASGLTAGNALVATGTASFAWGQVDHLNLAHIGSNTHAQLDTALTRLANTSGSNTGDQIVPTGQAGAAHSFLTAYNAVTGAFSKAQPTWADVDKTTSSLADVATHSHTVLTDIGTNTHAQIDTALMRLANTSGTNTGDQTLAGLGGAPTSRLLSTTAPLAGGGDLSADRTLSLAYTANLKVTSGNLDTAQGLQTSSSPQFAGLTVGTLGGVLKATAGVLAGSAVHADLGGIGANDHHNQQHVLGGADHTASGLTTGNALLATGATTFAWGQVDHTKLSNIGTNAHAQIDTALTRLANTSGTNTGDQTSVSGNAGTVTGFAPAGGKVLTLSNSLTLAAPNDTGVYTLPAGPATLLATNGSAANLTSFPTLNQNTTGSSGSCTGNAATATKWATARNLAGNSVDGSADVAFANKFIAQGTVDSGLSGAQFLGALGTGIVKNTTSTGVLSIAAAGDFPTLNQNTTGSSGSCTGNAATATALAAQYIDWNAASGGAAIANKPTLGTMASQAASAVAITGGSVTGLTGGMTLTGVANGLIITANINGTPLSVLANGIPGTEWKVIGGGPASTGVGWRAVTMGANYTLPSSNIPTVDNATGYADAYALGFGVITGGTGLTFWSGTGGGVAMSERMRLVNAGNLLIGTTTDGMTAAGSLAVAQDLAHRGTNVGFYNTAPIAKPSGDVLAALSNLGLITSPTLAQADVGGLTTASSPQFTGLTLGSASAAQTLTVGGDTGLYAYTDNASGRYIYWRKAQGSQTSPTIVQSGDVAGQILWQGWDGSGWRGLARIEVDVDGTPGTNDMPGRLVFLTTADGAGLVTERLRINNAGSVLIGTTTDGMTANGSLAVAQDLAHRGSKAGFFNTAPTSKPTVTGSRGGNAALASLLTALAGLGLVTDSTSA